MTWLLVFIINIGTGNILMQPLPEFLTQEECQEAAIATQAMMAQSPTPVITSWSCVQHGETDELIG